MGLRSCCKHCPPNVTGGDGPSQCGASLHQPHDLLTIELPAYQIRAKAECVKLVAEQSNLWKFWVSHEQNLPPGLLVQSMSH
jgi:hypothetical protein